MRCFMFNKELIMYTRMARLSLIILPILVPLVALAADRTRDETEQPSLAPRMFPAPSEAAKFGLEELRKVGLLPDNDREIYAEALGFHTSSETVVAELGVGLRTYDVSLKQLEKFQAEDDPAALLLDIHEIIFPLLVEGQPRSSLTIAESEQGKGWRVLKKGRSTLIRLIERYRTSNEDNLVLISSLGLRFLGRRCQVDQNELVLIPLADQPLFHILAGQPVLARDLFLQLSTESTTQGSGGQKHRPSIKR